MRLWFGVSLCWRMCLMSDPSLPAFPVSNVSFHSSRLPGDWFSMKSMLLLVPALRLQTQTCLLGLRTYLLSSSSSPPLPLILSFLLPFSSLPRRLQVFVFSLFLLSSQDRWDQTAWQFFLSFLFTFFLALSLSIPLFLSLGFSKLHWEKSLIYHFEGGKSALVYLHTWTHSLMDLAYCIYIAGNILVQKQMQWLKHTFWYTDSHTATHANCAWWEIWCISGAQHQLTIPRSWPYFSRNSAITANLYVQIYNREIFTVSFLHTITDWLHFKATNTLLMCTILSLA